MAKLTLSVQADVIERARNYAARQGTSISRMVEAYLDNVASGEARSFTDTPVLKSLRGILKKSDIQDYKGYLAAKYR